MKEMRFIGYKISSAIDLKKVAAFFSLPAAESWENSITLCGQQLMEVYKYKLLSKRITLFEYGCVVFQNFKSDETGIFFNYLQSIIGNLDYKMLVRYNENLISEVFMDNSALLWKGSKKRFAYKDDLADIAVVVLAKSIALSKLEADVELLLDEAESFFTVLAGPKRRFFERLHHRTSNIKSSKYSSIMAHILKFEYESAVSIRIFDRPSKADRSMALRDAYDELAEYFELQDRYDVLEKKIAELRNISRSYSTQHFWKQERRLLLFEIFLLALFPLSYLVHDFLRENGIEHVWKIFVN